MNENPLKDPLKISIQTFGCRLNQYESDGILQEFISSGRYKYVTHNNNPDLLIVNSCTVTNQADKRGLKWTKKFKENNPCSKIVYTGCYAQTDRDILQANSNIDLVVGNDKKTSLFSIIEAQNAFNPEWNIPIGSTAIKDNISGFMPGKPRLDRPFAYGNVLPQNRIRAYLKIQDGCDRKCSYCKIPQARGPGVSRNYRDILDHVAKLDDSRIPEIVLTGVNLGWYKDKDGSKIIDFNNLLIRILDQLNYSRIRLSSIEPCDIDTQLGELSQHPSMCDYFHIPVQSGSRKILKLMRRTYNRESFLKRVKNLRKINPDLFIGTDVILGFPGETENDFQQTLDICKEAKISKIHGFRFSKRNGTHAADLSDQIPNQVMKERMKKLMQLSEKLNYDYSLKYIDKVRGAILEKIVQPSGAKNSEGYAEVLSDNYLRIRIPLNQTTKLNKSDLLNVKITQAHEDGKYLTGNVF